jgi:hypothetical protein
MGPLLPSTTGASRLRRTGVRGLDLLLTLAAVTLVAAPLLFTTSGFAPDFTNHLWTSWVQSKAIMETGHPSYFINAPESLGVFYPFFAFYGGTLYVITGGLADLLGGQPVLAFVGLTVLAIAGTYTGALWLGRQLGLKGWLAHAPALTVVTSAYYITNLYGRGAWTELIATAMVPPLLASGLSLVRSQRWHPGTVLVFVLSAAVLSGSHNITLVWAPTMIALGLFVTWLALDRPLKLPYRRLAMVGGLGVASTLVNAWFLVTDAAYAKDVVANSLAQFSWAGTSFLNTPGVQLDPLREVPSQSGTPALFVQIPDWFLAWGLLAGAILLWRRPVVRSIRRAWAGAVILVALVLGMIMIEPFWKIVPFPLNQLQFPYRLDTYVVYAAAGLVLVGGLALQRAASNEGRPRAVTALRLALIAVCTVSVALCVWQQWVPEIGFPGTSYPTDRGAALASVNAVPVSWYDGGSYRDSKEPVVVAPQERQLLIDPRQIHDDRFAAWIDVPPGSAPIQTNIGGGGYLVHISGVERVGRNSIGYTVVRRVNGGSGPVHVVVEGNYTTIIKLGWAISIIAMLAILTVLLSTSARTLKARRRAKSTSDTRGEPAGAPLG